jgi:hypothetical protein
MVFLKTLMLIAISLIMLIPALVIGAMMGMAYFLDIWIVQCAEWIKEKEI